MHLAYKVRAKTSDDGPLHIGSKNATYLDTNIWMKIKSLGLTYNKIRKPQHAGIIDRFAEIFMFCQPSSK